MMRDPGGKAGCRTGAENPAGKGPATTIKLGLPYFPNPVAQERFRDTSCYADLWSVGCRRRSGRRPLPLRDRRSKVPRFYQRYRGYRARTLPPARRCRHDRAGQAPVAHLEPVPHSGPGEVRPAPRRQHLRRHRVLRQLRRRSLRAGDQDRAQIPVRDRPSRALSGFGCQGSFHGRTLRDLGRRRQRSLSQGLRARRWRASTTSPSAISNEMRAAIGKETAAIMVEPIQGEGGVARRAEGYLRGLREICRRVRPAARLRRGADAAWAAPASCSPTSGRGSRPM